MTSEQIRKLCFTELRELLLANDGKSRAVKEIALEELLDRKFDEGVEVGEYNERTNAEMGS